MPTTKTTVVPANEALAQDWENARQIYQRTKLHGRLFLVGQVLLGWQLTNIKKTLGLCHGGDRRSSRHVGDLKSWKAHCKDELDLPDRTADRIIDVFEAARKRLKTLGGHTKALALFDQDPGELKPSQTEAIQKLVTSITDGETQRSLLQELKLVKAPKTTKGGHNPGHGDGDEEDEEPTMLQLALGLFTAPLNQISMLRAHGDYQPCLHALHVISDDPNEVTLTTLESEAQALLQDVREAKAARLQSTNKTRKS